MKKLKREEYSQVASSFLSVGRPGTYFLSVDSRRPSVHERQFPATPSQVPESINRAHSVHERQFPATPSDLIFVQPRKSVRERQFRPSPAK